MRVTVLGASGTIGQAIVPVLAADHEVVAVSRSQRSSDDPNVTWLVGDITNASSIHRALDGTDVVVHLVHSLGSSDFAARDRRGARIVARAATASGVSQIVYLGGLGEDTPQLSEHLRSRIETEQVLSEGSVPVTSVRAAMVVGAGSAAFETILALVDRLPVMVCPRWVATPTQPIAIDDIVRYLVGVCGLPEAIGGQFDAGGPEVMSYREMIERIARLRGRHPHIVEVPVLTPRLSSYWLHLVTPVNAGIARPLIDGLKNATLARDDRLRKLVPFELTSFDDAARAALYSGLPPNSRSRPSRLRASTDGSPSMTKLACAISSSAFASQASCSASTEASSSPARCASETATTSSDIHSAVKTMIRSLTRPGRASNSAPTEAKKQPPGNTRRSRWSRNRSISAHSRRIPSPF